MRRVPKRLNTLDLPRSYVLSRGKWPRGPFKVRSPDELYFYVGIVQRLIDLCEQAKRTEGRTVTAIARDADLSPQTVFNVLEGKSWCELPTIFRLEVALNAPLWHHDHISPTLTHPAGVGAEPSAQHRSPAED